MGSKKVETVQRQYDEQGVLILETITTTVYVTPEATEATGIGQYL